MAKLEIKPLAGIKAEIHLPGDKSISHRAVMLGSLAQGETIVSGFLPSADCLATVECFKKLGIKIEHRTQSTPRQSSGQAEHPSTLSTSLETSSLGASRAEEIIIYGNGLKGLKPTKEILDVGNSGTTIRLISGILAGQPFTTRITGDASIQKRPMMRVVKPLREMGASIEGRIERNNIYAPLEISGGKLTSIEYELPVASAQVKSAVLLAGLFADGETVVIEKNQARDHTERMLAHFGADIMIRGNGAGVKGGRGFKGTEINIPGDLSSAAFFIVAGLIIPNSELLIRDVGLNPTRTGIIDVLHRMGADLQVLNERLVCEEPRGDILVKSSELKGIKISGEIIPRIIDEIPVIALAATQAEGTTEISGARELRLKESDRLATISSELEKLGAHVKELEDGLVISGKTILRGSTVKSYGDHRVAMTLAIAGLIAEGKTVIEDTACVDTSFPGFGRILKELGK